MKATDGSARMAGTAARRAGSLVRILCCAALAAVCGCGQEPEPDKGAHQSLVEIGERSLELGEELESRDKLGEANLAYKRALWAFRYHEQLTGEEPFLLDDALDGMERTTKNR